MNLKQGDTWQVWNGHRDYSDVSDLKYHSEWGWIMPVVEHIESINTGNKMHTVVIQHSQCEIFQESESGKKLLFFRESAKKITAVYLAVVAFIEWYQNQ